MKDNVYICVENKLNSLIRFLIYKKIYYNDLIYDNNMCYLTVKYDDYKKISRRYNTKVIKFYGKRNIKYFIEKNKHMILALIFGLIFLYILQSTIFSVEIKTGNKELYEKINQSLIKNGIERYKRKKSFKELKRIKERILEENEDILEWIEIKENGCNYEILLTQRIKGQSTQELEIPANIVAKKDGLILYITSSKGEKIKYVNDYVKKGDIIISGNIKKNEDTIKNQVRASGNVYAEVWYTANVTVPFNYIEYSETGKVINHYYLDILGKKITLLGKYESSNTMNTKKLILEKPYLFFKLYKEEKREYKYNEYKITKEEAYNEALRRAEDKIKLTLDKGEYIISKKVLKKEEFSSKITIEVFFKVYENIGKVVDIELKEELYGEDHN